MEKKFIHHLEDKVIEYEVSYDPNDLEYLKKEIIYQCGYREHQTYTTVFPPNEFDIKTENLKKEKVGIQEGFEGDRTIYRVEYDLIKVPKIAEMIENLLERGSRELFNFLLTNEKLEDYKDAVLKEEQKLIEQLYNMKLSNKSSIGEAKKICERILEIENNQELNKSLNLKSQNDYIPILKEKITFNKISEIGLKTYKQVKQLVKYDE